MAMDPQVVAATAPHTITIWRPRISATIVPPAQRAIATSPAEVPVGVAPAAPPDKPAEQITYVPPVYPRTARWLGINGHVTLAIVVRADGTVTKTPHVVTVNPTGQGFAESALDAVRTWRFTPAIREGRPVKSTLTIDVEFELLGEQALK